VATTLVSQVCVSGALRVLSSRL